MTNLKIDPSEQYSKKGVEPLDPFFAPKSIAIIGATTTRPSVGYTLMNNLISGGFKGKIYPVNPKYSTLFDLPCYPSIEEIKEPIDLVIIITPAKTVPGIIEAAGKKQVKGAVIISAGFKELGVEGTKLENLVLEKARASGIRIIGPNCLGVMNPHTHFNGTFAASMAQKGSIAFISQSGAMCTAVLDWSLKENIGFSAFVSIGSMADINWGHLIDYLGSDPHTKSILIYMETIGNARDFLSAAKEVALSKPIIVIKPGRTEAAAKAAASHTGSLSGSDEVFDAAMQRVGVLRVDEIGELFNMAEVLAKQPTPKGPNLAIITNAGGPAVLATDATARYGAEMATLSQDTVEKLSAFLPNAWSHGNPVDLLGDADPTRYEKAFEIVAKDPNVDGILVILSPQDMTDSVGTAKSLIPYAKWSDKPLLASWMGGAEIAEGEKILSDAGIPSFPYADSASRTFASMWKQQYAIEALYETPEIREGSNVRSDRIPAVETIIEKALSEGRELLTEEESKRVLLAYGIPTVTTVVAKTKEAAVKEADKIGYPVVLKLHSETITHKSDVGGVILNLKEKAAVQSAFETIRGNVPSADFQGVTVQKMINLKKGYEIIIGSSIDPQFGPVLLFGTGGELVEVYKDRALGLPPLNATLAKRLMSGTKIYEALKGVRGRKPVDMGALEEVLISFSELIVNHPKITELDINPLVISDTDMIALDARVVLSKKKQPRPAIRPYPSNYISHHGAKTGDPILIRPIRPDDEPILIDFHRKLSKETVKARFFEEMTLEERIGHERLIRVCHSDYDRDLLLLAIKEGNAVGALRLVKAPVPTEASIKLVIIDEMQGQGLGSLLLEQAIEIAKKEGYRLLKVQLFANNERMKTLLKKRGFTLTPSKQGKELLDGELPVH